VKARRSPGRPLALTEQVIEAIALAIRQGATQKLACAYAGISVGSFHKYIRRAEGDDPPPLCTQLVEAIAHARGQRAVAWLAQIERAGKKDWKALAWKLERIEREDFGRQPVDVQHSGSVAHELDEGTRRLLNAVAGVDSGPTPDEENEP